MLKLHIKMQLLREDKAVGGTGTTRTTAIDEWTGYFDLVGTPEQAKKIIERLRKVARRELIRLGVMVPSDEDKTR